MLRVVVGFVVLALAVSPLLGEQRTFYGAGFPESFAGLAESWDRPAVESLAAGKAFWESTSFYVDTTGTYEFRHSIASFEPPPHEFPRVLFLYAQSFDPLQPSKNLLGAVDLSDGRDEATVAWHLLAHTMYHLVLSTVGEARPLDSAGENLGVETTLSGPGKILRSSCRFTDDTENDADSVFWSSEAAFVTLPFDGFEQICAEVLWWADGAAEGEANLAQVAPLRTEDSALFYFFDPLNWEINLKVLDGCSINDHYWVLASASTDVRFRISLRFLGNRAFPDRDSPFYVPDDPNNVEFGSGALVYESPADSPASAFIDVLAFHCDE